MPLLGTQTDVHFINDDDPVVYLLYDINADDLLAFTLEPKGNLKVSRFNPGDTSFLPIANIKEITCAVDMFHYDAATGYVIFTATPNCDKGESVIVSYNIKTTTYVLSASTLDQRITDGSSFFI